MYCKAAAILGWVRYVGHIKVSYLLSSKSLELFNLLLSYCEVVPEAGSPLLKSMGCQTDAVTSSLRMTACSSVDMIAESSRNDYCPKPACTFWSVSVPSACQTHPTSCGTAATWQL